MPFDDCVMAIAGPFPYTDRRPTVLGVALAVAARLPGGSSCGTRTTFTHLGSGQKPPKVCCPPTLSATGRTPHREATRITAMDGTSPVTEKPYRVEVQPDCVRAVVQPWPVHVRGRRVLKQVFFDDVPVEPAIVCRRRAMVVRVRPLVSMSRPKYSISARRAVNRCSPRSAHQDVYRRRSRVYASPGEAAVPGQEARQRPAHPQ
jgi:hypothetical protein